MSAGLQPAGEAATGGVLGVIPARYASTRFPGKLLARLWDRPLLWHVWERARTVPGLDRLVIATDDARIAGTARDFGAEVEWTAADCATGTDRVAEVARRWPAAAHVVNLQGDEPEFDTGAVGRLVAVLRAEPTVRMATLAHREPDAAAFAAPEVVKVWVDAGGFAVDFRRDAGAGPPGCDPPLRHVGIYGFARDLLLEFAGWPVGRRERAERLEQLRALERGVRIRVLAGARPSAGVDTPAQLAALERRGRR